MQPTHTAKLYQTIAQSQSASKLPSTGTEASKYTTTTGTYKPTTSNHTSQGYSSVTQTPKYQTSNSSNYAETQPTKSYGIYSSSGAIPTTQNYQPSHSNNSTYQPSAFKVQSNQTAKPTTTTNTSSYHYTTGTNYVPTASTNQTVEKKKFFSDATTPNPQSNTNSTATYLPLKKYEITSTNSAGGTPSNRPDTAKYYTPTAGNSAQGNYRSVTPQYYRPYTANATGESNYGSKEYNPNIRNYRLNTNTDSKSNTSFQGYSTPKEITKNTTTATSNYSSTQNSNPTTTHEPKQYEPKKYEPKKYEPTGKPYEPSFNTTTSHKRIPSGGYTPSNYTASNPSTPGGTYKYTGNYQPKNPNSDVHQNSHTNTYTNPHASDTPSFNKSSSEKYIPSSSTKQYTYSNFASNRYNSPSKQNNYQQPNLNTSKPSVEKIGSERESNLDSKDTNTNTYQFGIKSHQDKFTQDPKNTKDKTDADVIQDMTESKVRDRPRLRSSLPRDDVIQNGNEIPPVKFTDSGKIEYIPPIPSFNKVQSRLYPLSNKGDSSISNDSFASSLKIPLFSPSKMVIEDGRPSVSQASFRHYEIPESTARGSRRSAPANRLSEIGRDILSKCSEKSLGFGSKYTSLLEKLLKEGKKYEDPDFKADINSLAGDDQFKRQKWAKYIWCRPEEFYGDGYEIFYDGVDINDIYQGLLGNCYFLSVLSALAEFPHLIMKLFVSADVNKAGCYAVRICDGGEWKEIIVDDLFPCKPGNPSLGQKPSPIFSRGNGKELWVLLMEKAWAKNYGSYAKIDSGFTRETMRDLTGAPTEYFIPNEDDNDLIWEKIKEGEERNYVMTCGAGDLMSGQDLLASCGLVGSHAYSLISAVELYDRESKREIKLVKLRNPWGKSEWNRAWSDGDTRWTDSLKKEVGLEERDDGIFFMEFFDFVQYFSDVQICRVNDFYHYYSYRTKSLRNEYKFYRIKCIDPGHYYITVNQPNKRHFKRSDQYQYSEAKLVLARLHKDKGRLYEYLDGLSYGNKEVWVEGDMSIGEYILCVNIDWVSTHNEFVLSSYGPGECTFEEMGKSSPPPKEFLEQVYLSHAQKNCLEKMRSVAGTGLRRTMMDRLKDGKEGIGYLFYMNEDSIGFKVEVNFVRKTGLELLFVPQNTSKIAFEIKSGETKVILWQIGFDEANISIQESLVKCKK